MSDGRELKIGERVVCVMDSDNEIVNIFGHGIVESKEIPKEGEYCGFNSHMVSKRGIEIFKCRLDDGKYVWKTEAYIIPEQQFEEFLQESKLSIINVDIDAERAEWKKNNLPITEADEEMYMMSLFMKRVNLL